MIPREACHGCYDDFYNQPGHALDGKRCWSAKSGKMMTRYAIGIHTMPATPGAFQQVRKPSCFKRNGTAYYNSLPDFVKLEDVIGSARNRAKSRRAIAKAEAGR